MQKAFIFAVIGVLCLLFFPLSNLMAPITTKETVLLVESQNSYAKKSAEIFTQKCLNCHTAKTNYPVYYYLPGAYAIINDDTKNGLDEYNITPVLFQKNYVVPENYLSKLETVLSQKSMPPKRYTMMHWGAALTDDDLETLKGWIKAERRKGVKQNVALWNEPIHPLQINTSLKPEKIELGRKLFHDTRLSGDNTISCASCHGLNLGGTDRSRFSTGISGQKGGINAPTVFNASNHFIQFWDGRAADLAEQAAGPVANPIEMGGDWKEVPKKILKDPEYAATFKKLYEDGVTADNITDAIAAFEGTLITTNSRFDQYLLGNPNAITDEEKKGYSLFKSTGCVACHMGVNVGGMDFEKFGKYGDYFKDRGTPTDADKGRISVTEYEGDFHKFKVPTLRNIDKTAPYFHDGSVGDLRKAVKVMAKYQNGKELDEHEADLIVAFLKTLTGEYKGKPLD